MGTLGVAYTDHMVQGLLFHTISSWLQSLDLIDESITRPITDQTTSGFMNEYLPLMCVLNNIKNEIYHDFGDVISIGKRVCPLPKVSQGEAHIHTHA